MIMGTAVKEGGWKRLTVLVVYGIGLGSMSLVGILSPLTLRITADLQAPAAAIGLTIALFSLPAAIMAMVGGGIVDRIGPRRALGLAAPVLAVADTVVFLARDLWLLDVGVLLAGMGYVGVLNGGAAMLMGGLDGATRTKAMALWSTYAPVGFSLGLLVAAPFTTAADWRLAPALHGAFMLLCCVGTVFLPQVPPRKADGLPVRQQVARLFGALRRRDVLQLAVSAAMPSMISYGTSLVAATYLAKVHGVSLAASASIVAVAKIAAVLLGGTITGTLLARDFPPRILFTLMVGVGMVAQFLLFFPGSPLPLAVAGLMGWLFTFGALSGVCMAAMPLVAGPALGGGTVAGTVNQFVSLASFLTPTIYFASSAWGGYVAIALAGLAVALVALPGIVGARRRVVPAVPAP
ncbi:putative MFS family arabinose efflux permease [Nitrospirillum iridis]|uniref:Putative MFS family arabinose efflux permease n=2 Tax=Nitrospirillum iridis TaxID=765888 RepID=A0A7X0EG52_9PROT|nr:putative MFS family arabinose efflux permease [Nitrospirillum iridis]